MSNTEPKYVEKNTLATESPYECIVSHKIQLHHSTVSGLGVFARDKIIENELIERFPLVPLAWRARYVGDPMIWRHIIPSSKDCKCSDCKNHGLMLNLCLGYGAVYNHQDEPNAVFKINHEKLYVDVIALKDISVDSEIFVSYGDNFNPPEGKVIVKNNE